MFWQELGCNFRTNRKAGLEFSWILIGMNLSQDQRLMNMQLKEQEIFTLAGKFQAYVKATNLLGSSAIKT